MLDVGGVHDPLAASKAAHADLLLSRGFTDLTASVARRESEVHPPFAALAR
jgi:hypothetical protein